jgi:nitroimidazol reductase NimA-like FMN-containing flavoprotein (pyridoxamine 5'-phosphate oxidase superfamily)
MATIGTDGRPHIVPVWGVLADDDLYLEVGAPSTAKVRHLQRDPRVAVHVDDADDVVIVERRARFE